MRLCPAPCVIAALLAAPPSALSAQDGALRIGLTLEAAAATSTGGATILLDDPEGPFEGEFRQGASAAGALRADLERGRWRLELGLQYVPAGLFTEFSDGTGIGLGGADARVVEVVPRLGYRIHGRDGAGTLHLLAGPAVQLWSVDLEDTRLTLAAGLDLLVEAPLGPRLRLAARGGVTRGPSFFGDDFGIEDVIERTAVTRLQAGIGLRWLLRQ